MIKLDLRQQWKHLYAPSARRVELVDVPELKFVMIDTIKDNWIYT